jgi:long-chain acyl-CoA synthetase
MDPATLEAACATGTELAPVAATWPDRVALTMSTDAPGEAILTFAELEANVNRLARALRHSGLELGDGVALLCSNRAEWIETYWATQRCGFRLIPVNWHLEAADVGYVISDSGARALIAEDRFAELTEGVTCPVRLSIGGPIDGFVDYAAMVNGQSGEMIDGPVLGSMMIYTSGTTGRPKGVRHPDPDPAARAAGRGITALFDFQPDKGDVMLCTAPLYHSGPSRICNEWPLGSGIGVVLMDRFDPLRTLELIERHRVTHAFMVPTMFHRLLALPEAERAQFNLSSIRFVLHGAAPATVESKQAMMDWFGPVIHEMFAATEGFGSWITPQEWLDHPGSVGRANPEAVCVLDNNGRPLPPGVEGMINFKSSGEEGFSYHGDSERTADVHDGSGDWFTVGDIGQIDDDGYLFITGRDAEIVISGGVNIYPARVDEALLDHPYAVDACSFGVPDADYGEVLLAHVILAPGKTGGADLEAELIAHCHSAVGIQMSPRRVIFVDSLPRSEAGKLYRRRVRAPYWDAAGADKP